jgi:membrane protein
MARMRPWVRAFREALLGDAPVLAAGVALFALLAAIPTLAATVSIYGLVADPADIQSQLAGLDRVLPSHVVRFLTEQLAREAGRSSQSLGIALVTTLALALYSARSTVDALMVGLNRAYGVVETRHPFRTFLISVAVAFVTLIAFVVVAAAVVALPALLAIFRVHGDLDAAATLIRWPFLVVVVLGGLRTLYLHAPSPRDHAHRRLWPGAVVAASLWMVVSFGLSVWVDDIADYESLYGAFASVLVLILWFYLSALAILLGGLVNAELERADTLAEPRPPI